MPPSVTVTRLPVLPIKLVRVHHLLSKLFCTMVLLRRETFSAAHRLHSPHLTDDQNRQLFGQCNNPHGHGHNYVLEVRVVPFLLFLMLP